MAIVTVITLSSCHKDKNDATPTLGPGVYVLNQGGLNSNNGSLSFYSYTTKSATSDIYSSINAAGLGDTPNDLKVYGSKMYIVVNVSNTVDVVNPKTGKLIKQISFGKKLPRSIAFYKNNAFVTSYDGTVSVIDTATYVTTKSITVGLNPEQLVVSNGKLYVANSGGLSPTLDKTVSVIDLNTLAVIKTINVITNPVEIAADSFGHVYVVSNGDFNTILPGITVIDNTSDTVISQTATDVAYGSPFIINNSSAYYITGSNAIVVYDVQKQAISSSNFITDGTALKAPYGIGVNASSGEVFITDAVDYKSNGTVTAFDKTGKKEYAFNAGINPANIVFMN